MQKQVKFGDLVNYFETLASEHKEIQHLNEKKHFYRFELDEVLSGINNINYPALILEGYSIAFKDSKSDNVLKTREGAFMLIDYVSDIGDYNKIHEAWDRLESIGDDILRRIRRDKKLKDNPIANFNIESVKANLIATEMGNHFGIRYTFDIDCIFDADIDDSKWIYNFNYKL